MYGYEKEYVEMLKGIMGGSRIVDLIVVKLASKDDTQEQIKSNIGIALAYEAFIEAAKIEEEKVKMEKIEKSRKIASLKCLINDLTERISKDGERATKLKLNLASEDYTWNENEVLEVKSVIDKIEQDNKDRAERLARNKAELEEMEKSENVKATT